MASRITARFFQVLKDSPTAISPSTALREIAKIEPVSNRIQGVADSSYRLERFSETGGFIDCEIVKIQSENMPAEVTPTGLDELTVEELGFSIAFSYDANLSVLAMQYDNRIVSSARLGQYLLKFSEKYNYNFLPIPGPNLWEDFQNGTVKSINIKVASPQSFSGSIGNRFEESIDLLAQAYEAPYITIGLSVGHRKQSLADILKKSVSLMMGKHDIVAMKTNIVESVDEIDLLEQMLVAKDRIDIPKNPKTSYSRRREFVRASLKENRDYLEQFIKSNS